MVDLITSASDGYTNRLKQNPDLITNDGTVNTSNAIVVVAIPLLPEANIDKINLTKQYKIQNTIMIDDEIAIISNGACKNFILPTSDSDNMWINCTACGVFGTESDRKYSRIL